MHRCPVRNRSLASSSSHPTQAWPHAGFKENHGWQPFVGVGYGGFRGDNTSALVTDKGIDFWQRVPLHRRLAMEVRAQHTTRTKKSPARMRLGLELYCMRNEPAEEAGPSHVTAL